MGFFDRAWNLGKGLAKVHGGGQDPEEARLRALALEEELRRAGLDRSGADRSGADRSGADRSPVTDRGRPSEERSEERPEERPPAKRTL